MISIIIIRIKGLIIETQGIGELKFLKWTCHARYLNRQSKLDSKIHSFEKTLSHDEKQFSVITICYIVIHTVKNNWMRRGFYFNE